MKTLVFGAGNLLLSDEGFGVHCIRHLEERYVFPEEVELYDGGTLGIMVNHKFEEAEQVIVIDTVAAEGAPGDLFRYDKADFMLGRLPLKLSPHQIGIQEVLALSEIRGCCPERVTLIGIIPDSLEAGCSLSPILRSRVPEVASMVLNELRRSGITVTAREHGSWRATIDGLAA